MFYVYANIDFLIDLKFIFLFDQVCIECLHHIMDQQLLNHVRELLHNTFTNQFQIQQSEMELNKLLENEPVFAEIICNIALNDSDIPIRKAAIIQIRHFSAENILKFFVLLNEKLDPNLHTMITFLSDLLSEKHLQFFINFYINFNNNLAKSDINEDFIIHEKTLMMALLSLIKFTDDHSEEIFIALKSLFNDKLLQIVQLIDQILKSNINSEEVCFSQQQILFFHYFTQVFNKFFYRDRSYMDNFYEFIHFFLCTSLKSKIDFIYPDINSTIASSLLGSYSLFFESSEKFQQNIRFNEIIDNFEIFKQNISIQCWPVNFIMNIKLFFTSNVVFEKYKVYTEQIIENYIFPLFSFNFFTNITDDTEFVDLYYPNKFSNNLQGFAISSINCSFHSDYITSIIYKVAHKHLNQPQTTAQNIFSIINMISYSCYANRPYQLQCLTEFSNFINSQLMTSNDPLIIISILHFLSKLPETFKDIPPNFINYIFNWMFNQNTEIPSNYINIIRYFSFIAYSNFLSNEICSSFNIDQEKMKFILDNAINFNEYFKTEDASAALEIIINDLSYIDDNLLCQLINIVWKLFMEETCNDVYTAANYFITLITIFEKCTDQVKYHASEILLNLIDELLYSSMKSNDDALMVFRLLDTFGEEIFRCLSDIVSYLTKILPPDQCNALFVKIKNSFALIFTILTNDEFEWEYIDTIFMNFVNLNDKIDHQLLLQFFESLVQTIVERDWCPTRLYCLKAFIANFSAYPDVQEFRRKYNDAIVHIYEQIEKEEEEEITTSFL